MTSEYKMTTIVNYMVQSSYHLIMKTLIMGLLFSIPCRGITKILYVDPYQHEVNITQTQQIKHTYKSLHEASSALEPGDELVIYGGIYRESIQIPKRKWLANKPTVIRAHLGETVTIKGSDIVTGWKSLGDGLFVKYNWTSNSQQVFLDGQPLAQIGGSIFNGYPDRPDHTLAKLHLGNGIWPGRKNGGLNNMTDLSFFFDPDKKMLFVKLHKNDSLSDHTIEVSVRSRLLEGMNLRYFIIKDLTFQHANASSTGRGGAVHLHGDYILVENVKIFAVDSVGLLIRGNYNQVENSNFSKCGQVGLVASGRHFQLLDTETSGNNTRGFNKYWEAGGAKFGAQGGLHDAIISGHRAYDNNGDGLWVDWKNTNNTIRDCVTAYNTGHGIHYEASATGRIENNYSYANHQRGIYLPHSSNSIIVHNLVAFNNLEGVVIIDEGREDPKGEFDLRPRNNKVIGNILAWNSSKKPSLVLPADLLGNQSDYNLYITKAPPTFSLGWPFKGMLKGSMRISSWIRASGQDIHSWSLIDDPPEKLLNSIRIKKNDIDWSPLFTIAKKFSITDEAIGIHRNRHPGPGKP